MKQQQGAVMIAGLVLLLVLGVVGTSSLNHVNVLERMVANIHDANRAYQGAEAALSVCEDFLDGLDVAYNEQLLAQRIHKDDDEEDVIIDWVDSAEPHAYWWKDWGFLTAQGEATADLQFAAADKPGRLSFEPRCFRQRIVGRKTEVIDADTDEVTDADSTKAEFSKRYANVENLMADQSGDAATSGGIYHFRVTGAAFGIAVRSDGQGRSKAVMQSDFFKRLN